MRAVRPGIAVLKRSASVFTLVLALGGCASVDSALFGGDNSAGSDTSDMSAAPPPAAEQPAPTSSQAGTLPPASGASSYAPAPYSAPTTYPAYSPPPSSGAMAGTLPMASAPPPSSMSGVGRSTSVTPIAIEPGADTGTAVSKTIQSLRAQISNLESRLASNSARLSDLRNAGAGEAAAYHQAKAQITTRLQVGTTRGNPELVGEWNTAQSALDQMTGNINALNALGTDLSTDSSSAHYALDTISATFNVSGAVDEDHRQLSVLEDETNQTVILIDRLLREVSTDIQRQTADVANERMNMTTLSGAIKNGELYGSDAGGPMLATPTLPSSGAYYGGGSYGGGSALVTIKFDRANVDYQQILYSALTQTLQSRPSASFQVVAVSPTRGSAASVQLAQTSAKRHAQDVLRSMTDMGVPASRLSVSSATDPGVGSSEVRVMVR